MKIDNNEKAKKLEGDNEDVKRLITEVEDMKRDMKNYKEEIKKRDEIIFVQKKQLEEVNKKLNSLMKDNKNLKSELDSSRRSPDHEQVIEDHVDNLRSEEELLIQDTKEKIESLDKEFEDLYKV